MSPWLLPAAMIAGGFVVLTFLRPAWALAGALAALPIESVGITAAGLSPTEAAFALIGAAWLARALLRPETVAMPQVRDASIAVLLGIIALGIAVAEDPFPVARLLVLWTLFYFVYLQVQTFTIARDQAGGDRVRRWCRGAGRDGNARLPALGRPDAVRGRRGDRRPRGAARSRTRTTMPRCSCWRCCPRSALVLTDLRRYAFVAAACAIAFAGIALSLSRGGLIAALGGVLLLLAWARARWVALGLAALFAVLTLARRQPDRREPAVQRRREAAVSTLSGPGIQERDRRAGDLGRRARSRGRAPVLRRSA